MRISRRIKYWLSLIGVVLVIVFVIFLSSQETEGDLPETGSSEMLNSDSEVIALDYGDEDLKVSDFYKTEKQDEIAERVNELKTSASYDMDNMLYITDPFQTNTTGLYVYFETEEAVKTAYNIHVEDEDIPDFGQTLFNASGEYAKTHEYQVIGLVPGAENTITFTMTAENGTEYEKKLVYTAPELKGEEEKQLKVTDGESYEALGNGLYTILGNDSDDQDFMYYYDNDGVIRGEIPILGYRSHRLLFDGQEMYMSISEHRMAKINHLGQVTKVYNLKDAGYSLHHDYIFDKDGNILILATDKSYKEDELLVEDQVILLDAETGEVELIADFSKLLPDLYEKATGLTYEDLWDPLHFNSLQLTDDDSILLSSRETSTTMKLSNICEAPELEYMIGDTSIWEDIGYTDLLLEKKGDFTSPAGQHTITYAEDETLPEGQYYLYLFDNNVAAMSSRPDFEWRAFPDAGDSDLDSAEYSSYCRYLVDEVNGTYELTDSFELPYSPYVSSVQHYGENIVFDSGMQGIFGEYDSSHKLIRSFEMEMASGFIYRVFKYDFEHFYFADS